MAGGGINALRGHANVQGITDFALYAQNLPGYLAVPSDAEPDLKTFLEKKTPKMLRPGQMNFGQNLPKWYVCLHKAWWGNAATKENGFAYDFMPKLAGASDVLSIFDQMYQGKVHGFLCQGGDGECIYFSCFYTFVTQKIPYITVRLTSTGTTGAACR